MKTERESFTERVFEGKQELMKEIEELQKKDEPFEDENYREPLAIDTQLVKHIQLSTGGPGDGFKLYFSVYRDGKKKKYELAYGLYYRNDWGEYKTADLTEEELQTVYDFYLGGYIEEEQGL